VLQQLIHMINVSGRTHAHMCNRQQLQQVHAMRRREMHVLRAMCTHDNNITRCLSCLSGLNVCGAHDCEPILRYKTLLVCTALSPTLCRLPALLLQDALASQPGRVTLHGAEQLPQQLACRHMEPCTIPQVGCAPCNRS
jgi:hypothetical protein